MKLTIHGRKTIKTINLHPAFFKNEERGHGAKRQIITPLEKARSISGRDHFILEYDGKVIHNSFKEKNRNQSVEGLNVNQRASSQQTHGHRRHPQGSRKPSSASAKSGEGHPKPKKKISFK